MDFVEQEFKLTLDQEGRDFIIEMLRDVMSV